MELLSPPKPAVISFNNHHENHQIQFSLSPFLPCECKKPKKNQNFIKWVPGMESTTTTTTTRPTTAVVVTDRHHQNKIPRHHQRTKMLKKEKLIVIMGATGAGKTKLSIELAKRFNGEIINSDKIQLYKGLDITTNKVSVDERGNIKHHLLGELDPSLGELTRSEFRNLTLSRVNEVVLKKKVPFLVGGSNSFVHASLTERFNPEFNVFDGFNSVDDSVSSELRYDCCFLWVDVSFNVLCDYLCKRVDEMVDIGMVDELAEFYESGSVSQQLGLRNAIGVPEFYRYFHLRDEMGFDSVRRGVLYEDAVNEIKENTCQLAKRQIEKILRLKAEVGWGLHRLDATSSFRKVLTMTSVDGSEREQWRELWARQVVNPSVKIVKRFLEEYVF